MRGLPPKIFSGVSGALTILLFIKLALVGFGAWVALLFPPRVFFAGLGGLRTDDPTPPAPRPDWAGGSSAALGKVVPDFYLEFTYRPLAGAWRPSPIALARALRARRPALLRALNLPFRTLKTVGVPFLASAKAFFPSPSLWGRWCHAKRLFSHEPRFTIYVPLALYPSTRHTLHATSLFPPTSAALLGHSPADTLLRSPPLPAG